MTAITGLRRRRVDLPEIMVPPARGECVRARASLERGRS